MLKQDTIINGRYRIIRVLGTGGMGSVYAVADERLGRNVALKLLRNDLASDQRARERFLVEAQIAAQLIHPNVVRTYDVGDAPEGPYLVQELLDGQTLDTCIPLPPQQAIAVIAGVTDALRYIHAQGYVHCDIKPQNIMLVGDPSNPAVAPRPVLLDFGIARIEGTQTTTLIATPHYLAPERALGAAPTASSDLYAVGIVLYQTLVGAPPFDAPTIHSIIMQHQTAPMPPLTINAPEAAPLDAIIRKLTAKQPEQRYASAADVSRDLANIGTQAIYQQPTMVVSPTPLAPAPAAPAPIPAAAAAPARGARPAVAPPPATHNVAAATQPRRGSRRWLLALPFLLGALLAGAALVRDRDPAAATNAIQPTVVQSPSVPAQPSAPAPPSTPAPPAAIAVPAVIGLPVEQARQQIEGAGLKFALGDAMQSDQPVGNVAQINPAPDQTVAPGTEIVVQPSSGLPPVVAPQPQDDDKKNDDKKNDDKKNDDKGKKK